jgi:hypothetical protein
MSMHFALWLNRFAILIFEQPIYVATASYFAVPEGYAANQAIIRRAQQSLISSQDVILPGPDTDLIRDRFDGCHMGSTGLREHARMWQTSLRGRGGVEFIDENGGGPGVRLRKRHQPKRRKA